MLLGSDSSKKVIMLFVCPLLTTCATCQLTRRDRATESGLTQLYIICPHSSIDFHNTRAPVPAGKASGVAAATLDADIGGS